MAVLTLWSDIRCPWSYVAAVRLLRARHDMEFDDVVVETRAFPGELLKGGPRADDTWCEVIALAQHEPTLFSRHADSTWPTTSLPALEAQKWGYALGPDVGEMFDVALRRALFLHGRDISQRSHLLEIAENEGLAADRLGEALDDGRFRRSVVDDLDSAQRHGVTTSPEIELPDGSLHQMPGWSVRWERGIPVIEADHPAVYSQLLEIAATEE